MGDFITFIGNVEGLKITHFTPSVLLSATLLMEKTALILTTLSSLLLWKP